MGSEGSEATTPRVRRLPDALVDQIAAGEVVERPASVVKELVENALDAGARRVRVEVRDGGRAWIAVADDGSGMAPEDARLALERHATSKLRDAGELASISSFGFRGEALPAIASVSRLRLVTRARGAAEGFEQVVRAGVQELARPIGAAEGTRVEVAELFAAVPARRKFLKSATSEWGHVADWLARAALALPEVHFDLARDDRPVASWPAHTDPLDRVAAVLGESEAAGLVPFDHREGGLRVYGFASRPDHHRATPAGIHLFVHRRPVRDRVVQHALTELYRDVLPRGRYPGAVLFLELPPGAVDVNVHPAKWEVRFADPRTIHRLVTATVAEAVSHRGWLATPADAAAAPAQRVGEAAFPARGASDWLFSAPRADAPTAFEAGALAPLPSARPFRFGELRLLGQLHGTYLLLEAKDGLLLVDQHAAHERVLYESLRAAWLDAGVPRQPLLVAETLELEPASLAALVEQGAEVAALGYEVEPFGATAVVVRAVPALLAGRDPLGGLRSLAEQLRAGEGGAVLPRAGSRWLDAADRLFASLACHSARRAGEVLPAAEQRALADALDAIPWAPTCPHGRPVAVPIGASEIARRFGRT